jgi:hypothetical protein
MFRPSQGHDFLEFETYRRNACNWKIIIIISIISIISIIIIIITVSFMQGIHTRIPETNHVPRGYIVAAILCLLFMVPLSLVPALALLFFYISTFRSMCAVPNMAAFCSSLTSCFPVCRSRIFWMIWKWFQSLQLLLASPLLLNSTRALFLL